jgi:serine protease Do
VTNPLIDAPELPGMASSVAPDSDAGRLTEHPPRPSRPSRRLGGLPQWLGTSIVGGLVGALVATGVFVVTDEDQVRTTIVREPDAAVSRPARAVDGTGQGIASIIAKVEPAVVAVTTGSGPGTGGGAGTGFVITADGFIVTNNHVVEGATRISVAFRNGDEKVARLVGREAASDIAVLKVEATGLPTVELGNSDDVQVGDEVVAIGNALALEGGLSVTRGIVSGLHRTVNTNAGSTLLGMLQTDAAINPGNSGGPLVDANGRVIAINTAIANPQSSNNVGFAIPMASARPVIDDLRLGRPAAFLGIAARSLTPAIAREQGVTITAGALVTRVTEGSAAERAGIREGDVVVSIAGRSVTEASQVQTLVRTHRPGDTVEVVVFRSGSQLTLRATLTERPLA